MTRFLGRSILFALVVLAAAAGIHSAGAAPLDEVRLDWATYNPVSIVIRSQGLMEKEFEKDGTKVRWVQSLGSNKALEFLNASSIDFGSTAGSAALVARINGNPIKSIYVYSRPEWTALVTRKDTGITKVADLKGKSVAVTRGTDPHIFLVRALADAGLSDKDVKFVLLQHADGRAALIRGDVDAWAGLDPMMAAAELDDGAVLFYRKPEANTWGILNVREEFANEHPDIVARVLKVYERGGAGRSPIRRSSPNCSPKLPRSPRRLRRSSSPSAPSSPIAASASRRRIRSSPPGWRCSRRASSPPMSTCARRSTN